MIISGPSGVGKGTLIKELLKRMPELGLAISHTTRHPRPEEEDGIDYHFVDDASFDQMIKNKQFLEWAHVHQHRYGTSVNYLEKLNQGRVILFEIDVQGAKSLIKTLNSRHVPMTSIFLLAPSREMLIARLKGRDTETSEALAVRVRNAEKEELEKHHFQHILVNNDLSTTTTEALKLIYA